MCEKLTVGAANVTCVACLELTSVASNDALLPSRDVTAPCVNLVVVVWWAAVFGRYIFEGLGHLVSTILINTAQYLKRINENGIKKM